jgi:hypothetical protein
LYILIWAVQFDMIRRLRQGLGSRMGPRLESLLLILP